MTRQKHVAIGYIIIIKMQSYPMGSYLFILIKIYFICPITFLGVNYFLNKHH